MSAATRRAADYREALERYIGGAGEDALHSGYEIGRRLMAEGLGILDIVSVHHEAVSQLVGEAEPRDTAALVGTAADFLSESLTPFEMSYRGVGEANAALRRLNELVEEDLKRVAHSLHDQAGSILASATMEMDLVTKDLAPPVRERLALARRLLDETGEQLRHISHELRPTLLDDLGLAAALDYLAEGIEQRSSIRVLLRAQLRERPPAAVETALYRIVQEALNNAVRHAGDAPSITVMIERDNDHIRCLVADDGVGFDVRALRSDGRERGMGVMCMRERAKAVGGTFDIRSAPGKGTTLEIVVPVKHSESKER